MVEKAFRMYSEFNVPEGNSVFCGEQREEKIGGPRGGGF